MDNAVWTAITELFFLMDAPETPEKEFQAYFERNPCVFDILGFDAHASFEMSSKNRLPFDPERDYTPMPDFLCARRELQTVYVFEIKRADEESAITSKKGGNRAKFREKISSYIEQTSEYIKSIERNAEARKIACETLGLARVRNIEGILVCGRSLDEEMPIVAELIAGRVPRIEYLYYDQIYRKLCELFTRGRPQYERFEDDYQGAEGVHLTLVVSIAANQIMSPAYIIDIGEKERNRVSIFVSDHVYVQCIDSSGQVNRVKTNIEFGEPNLFQVEFSNDARTGFLSILLNNREIFFAKREDGYTLSLSMENMTIGSDIETSSRACCIIGTSLLRYRTLGIEEKLKLLLYLSDNAETGGGVEFNGNQFMRRSEAGHLIQEQNELRPKYRSSMYYQRIRR
jgi:hypothetical protein